MRSDLDVVVNEIQYGTTIKINAGEGTSDHAENIKKCWNAIPEDKPFIGILIDNTRTFICGYLYKERKYGCVMYLTYIDSQGIVMRKNGEFSVKML